MNVKKNIVVTGLLVIWMIFFWYCNPGKSENNGDSENGEVANNNSSVLGTLTQLGEANIWFLGQSSFAVETLNYFLIFDYAESFLRGVYPVPQDQSLSNGYFNPQEIGDLNVRVFTSHEHGDHYDPAILQWAGQIDDIEYFFGWQASSQSNCHNLVGPRGTFQENGFEVYTINSYHSNVSEVAFLIKVDGCVIYHNGDYQGNFQADMAYLTTLTDRIDIAFLFGVWQDHLAYHDVNLELITRLRPGAVFPMHIRIGDEQAYFDPFKETFENLLEDGEIFLTNNIKGSTFYYMKDR